MVCYGFHDIGKSEKCRGTQPPFSLQCQVPMEEVPDQELEVTSSKLKPARTEATRPRFGSGSHGSHWQPWFLFHGDVTRAECGSKSFQNRCHHQKPSRFLLPPRGGTAWHIHAITCIHTPICNQYRCQKTTTTDGRTRAFLKVKESSNPASLSLVK